MGLFKFLKGEFIEVVHWEDDSQDAMVYKFPMEDKQQIKEGAKLIVRPSQVAIFVYEGQIADVYEPGKYDLHTDTMPIFTSLSNWKFKFENHFKTDVYFINTKQFTNQKWGTTNPIMMRDPDFGMLRLRGFGVYAFKVSDSVMFLKEIFGSNKFYTVDNITEYLKSLIVSSVSDVIAEAKIPAMDLAAQYDEIGRFAMARINERFSPYGLTISDFAVENLSLPESVEEAIDKRAQMGALGDLNNYMKYQTAEAITDAAQNPSGGMASMGAGMGAGMGIGKMMNEMMSGNSNPQPQQQQPQQTNISTTEMVACPSCGNSNKKDSKFCSECGYSFIKKCISCGHEISPNAKFCMECGASQVVEITCPGCGEKLEENVKFCPSCGEKL
jgi:membrane protease subunit (stomatin/prohibitin family)